MTPSRSTPPPGPGSAAAASPPASALLEVRGLGKRFGATVALDGVSLDVHAGEVHCVLGENGAGKSSLGKVVAGLYRPDTGTVHYDGREVRFATPRQARAAGIAIVYQELSLVPDLSVRANFWLGSERTPRPWGGIGRRAESPRVLEILRELGLELDPETRVKDLPVTTQQLLEIGKSLMHAPRLVVFDEPTAMLGAVEKQRFFEVLRRMRQRGIASILVTHHVDDVLAVGDRVTVMRNGAVAASFLLTPETRADDVLERLTGKRTAAAPQRPARAAEGEVVLDIEGVPARDGSRAVLSVARGSIVGLYGVVGCGAERLLQAAAGLVSADAGTTLKLKGRPYRPSSPAEALRAGVAYLPTGRAANGIFPARPIRENLMLSQLGAAARHGFIGRQREEELALTQLEACAVKFGDMELGIETLSGGNQQKVLLARAMAGARELLLLEEPTAGVDIEAKHQIHERIRRAAQAGLAVVVLSSDLPETVALCDTVYTFYAGALVGRYRDPDSSDQPAIVADILGQRAAPAASPAADTVSPTPMWSLRTS